MGQFQSQRSARPSAVSRMLSSRTSVCTRVSARRPPRRTAAASAAASSQVRQVPRSCVDVVPERRPRRRGRRRTGRAPARRAPGSGARPSTRQRVEAGSRSDARQGRLRCPRLDVLQAEDEPVVDVESSRAGGVPERRPAGRAACGPPRGRTPRTSAGRLRGGLHEVPRPVLAGEHGREARREAGFCDTAETTGDPQCCSTSARTAGGRWDHSSRRAVRPCGIVVGIAGVTPSSSPSRVRAASRSGRVDPAQLSSGQAPTV